MGVYHLPEGNRFILAFNANTQYKDRDVPTNIDLSASIFRDVTALGVVWQKRLIDYV